MRKFLLSAVLVCALFIPLLIPLSLIADCSYDQNSNISTIFIPGDGEVKYTYDPINRLTSAEYSSGKFFHYSYDYNSNITAIEGPQGKTSYTYALLDRLEKATFPDGSQVLYQYDCMGRLTQLTYPDGEEVTYRYNDQGSLVEVKEEGGVTRYEYDNITHLVTKEILANGVTTSYRYNEDSQVVDVLHQDCQGKLILHYEYDYDKQGNCIFIQEETPEQIKNTQCEYDLLDRLILVEDDQGHFEKYTYDSLGNRLSKATPSETIHYKYDAQNRLIQAGDTFYSYDSVGNLIKKSSAKGETTYSYDPTGKLIAYFDGSNHVTFEYDGHGNRISKTVNGKSTYFINDPIAPLSRVLMEKDDQGQWTKKYIYGNSRVAQKGASGSDYFLYNHPGKSVSCLAHANGTQTHLQYGSFGNSRNPSYETPYGFNGEEADPETGLIYLRNRYYDPEIGRFISPDYVLGSLQNPQTLNPYVFVLNNPLTFVDPTGLQAIKVPLRIYANPPGVRPGGQKSLFGHAWIGGVDEHGNFFTLGAWPEHFIETEEISRSFCDQTVHMTIWVTPEQLHQAKLVYNEPFWAAYSNCVDHVSKALDVVGYSHPQFNTPDEGAVSWPANLCSWINREKNQIHPNFLPLEGDILIGKSILESSGSLLGRDAHPSAIDLHFCRPNYGGVLLDKSAEVFTELSDISGVIYDEQTQQMILYGHKNLALPYMDMDDLAVAVRSIYGLGRKGPESPGVSMEPGYKNPKKQKGGCMVVSYFGETENTRFGQIMFEADRVLKILSIGKDNITGKPIKSSVPHYRDLQTIRLKEGVPPSNTNCRMWLVPQRIALAESQDGTSMVFSEARMEVLTESTLRKKGVEDRAAEKFAHHFTQYYDHFSREYPILTELKRLGKITAIVKWIHEKNLPFDLAFFQNYTPYYMETPKYSPLSGNTLVQQIILGGVVYTLDGENYLVQKHIQVDQIKEDVLRERPNDETLIWNFGRGMTAVAEPLGKSLKVGEVHKAFVDLSYPGGSIPLSFVRTYSSFNETSFPFGRGWDYVPAKIRFNHGLAPFSFNDGTTLNLYPQIIVQLEGVESIYTLSGLNQEKEPIYKKEGSLFYLIQDSQGTFTWHRQNETLTFSPQGRLTHLLDLNGKGLEYHYDQGYLTQISHSSGEAISLDYMGSQLHTITGPGGKILYYDYDPQGRLKEVRDIEGTLTTYRYDEAHRLIAIHNSKNHPIFTAKSLPLNTTSTTAP